MRSKEEVRSILSEMVERIKSEMGGTVDIQPFGETSDYIIVWYGTRFGKTVYFRQYVSLVELYTIVDPMAIARRFIYLSKEWEVSNS